MNPSHVAIAKDLVRRQRQIRERLQAVLGRQVEPQQAVRREALALSGELSDLRDRIRPISNRGAYPAFEAARHLRSHAAAAMDQAAEHLAQGQVPSARDAQRRASELVERACAIRRGHGRGACADSQAAADRGAKARPDPWRCNS